MSVLDISIRILPTFLLLGFGALLAGLKAADDGWVDVLNKYGLYIGFPAIVIDNLAQVSRADLAGNLPVYAANAGLLLFVIFSVYGAAKLLGLRDETANSYVVSSLFGNVAYLGYPVVTSVFPDAQGELSILISIYVVLLFTVGTALLEISRARRVSLRTVALNVLKNPLLLATFAGILLSAVGAPVPGPVEEALGMLKASASPVVLVALGVFIARGVRLRGILVHVVGITAVRLLIVPLLFYLYGRGAGLFPSFTVSVIEAGMPLGVTPFALSALYPLDRNVIGSAVVLSTLVSVATLPVLIAVLV